MHIGHYLYSASDEAIIKDRPLQQLSRVISACPDSIFSMQKCVVDVLEKKKKRREEKNTRESVRPYLIELKYPHTFVEYTLEIVRDF